MSVRDNVLLASRGKEITLQTISGRVTTGKLLDHDSTGVIVEVNRHYTPSPDNPKGVANIWIAMDVIETVLPR